MWYTIAWFEYFYFRIDMGILGRNIYFSIFIGTFAVCSIILLSVFYRVEVFAGSGSSGDPYTVCASGCDYTTITAAVSAASNGDYIQVNSGYTSTTEAYPLGIGAVGKSIVLSCQDKTTTIGTSTAPTASMTLSSDSIVDGCLIDFSGRTGSYNNVSITLGTGSQLTDSIIYDGAIKMGTSTEFSSSSLYFNEATSTMITVVTSSAVVSNTISFTAAGVTSDSVSIFADGAGSTDMSNLQIVSNTISNGDSTNVRIFAFYISGAELEIRGNKITQSGGVGLPNFFYHRGEISGSMLFTHNTYYAKSFDGTNNQNVLFIFQDDDQGLKTQTMHVTSTYNIFYGDTTGTSTAFKAFLWNTNVSGSRLYEDYNGYAGNMNSSPFGVGGDLDTVVVSGGNSKTTVGSSPLRDGNVDTSDDFLLNPMSSFLDVNGTEDIGAVTGTRASTFYIDDNGTIDYSTVHATGTTAIANNARSGDTWNIAAGTYNPFSVTTSTGATTGLTISGAGPTTIINGNSSYAYGIKVSNWTDLMIENLLVQNASSTLAGTYTATNMIFDYDESSYDDSSGVGIAGDGYTLFLSDASCDTVDYNSDGYDISSVVDDATEDFNLALVDFGGPLLTILARNDWYPTPSSVTTACGGGTVNTWVTSTFSASDGSYTYDAAAVAAAGITVTAGYTAPPAISGGLLESSGILLTNTTNATIANVTSTANSYGVYLTGSTSGTSFNSSTISNSVLYDVYSDATANNALKNTSFTTASSSITGTGNVDVYFKTRMYVTSTDGVVQGAVTTLTRGDSSVTTTLTTASDGYSPYSDFLLAFTQTSSSLAVTNGGYNPWGFTTAATSTYNASSTSANLISPNQLITMVVASAPASVPDAPTSLTISSISTSSIGSIAWSDNADDEDGYILDVAEGSDGSVFPSVNEQTDATANVISANWVGLTANTQYILRVAMYNGVGTSTYATSSAFYTLANVPTSLSASAASATSISLSWSGDGTTYILSNDTLSTTSSVAATSTTVTGLTCNTSYTFSVSALNGDGVETDSSDTASATTSACPVSTGGGGGFFFTKNTNIVDTTPIYNPLNMSLNRNFNTTRSRIARIRFNNLSESAVKVAISETNDFTDVVYKKLRSIIRFRLSKGVGEKTVYTSIKDANDKIIHTYTDTINYKPRITSKTISTTQTTPTNTNYKFTLFLSRGSNGTEVLELQKKLQFLGFLPATVTPNGNYGPATEAAVRDFQAANNISPLGYVGPGTREALNKQ